MGGKGGRRTASLTLPAPGPGTSRRLVVHEWGDRGARPKAYLQAGVHADEIPGMLVASRLGALLDAAAGRGEVRGRVVLAPAANPIGLAQVVSGRLLGRHDE